MKFQGTVRWAQDGSAVVDSADTLAELLEQLDAEARGHPFMIVVTAGDGRSLALGLGRNKAVLGVDGPDGALPYFASVGDENAQGDIWFEYFGEATEFPVRNAVPIASARVAAAQFLSEPGLPTAVRWEEV